MKAKKYDYILSYIIWFVASYLLVVVNSDEGFDASANKMKQQQDASSPPVKDARVLFSPRMDYDQWKPLGQGDPLKNDPTYDYAPPVLDRVHYWIDPAARKPDPAIETKKTEILLLGVSSKKPTTTYSSPVVDNRKDVFDSFLKFVEGPNLGNHRNKPLYSVSQNYYSPNYYKNNIEQKEPYTMLVPPPMPSNLQEENAYQQPIISSTSTTTPASNTLSTNPISIEEANLIYQSSSMSTDKDWKGSNTYATIAEPSSHVTWKTPTSDAANNTKSVIQSIPSMSAHSNFPIVPSINVVLNQGSKLQNIKNSEILSETVMHKGQVADDTYDLTNTYVNIGKPDAQMLTANGMVMNVVQNAPMNSQGMLINSPLLSSAINPMITPVVSHANLHNSRPPLKKIESLPITLQTIQTMQTMFPPPNTQQFSNKTPLIHSLLKNEISNSPTRTYFLPTTTTMPSVSTDSFNKPYKKPEDQTKTPLYLIIQGHSKVKTYGPSKQVNGIPVQEANEIPTSEDRQSEYSVKHLHDLKKDNRVTWDREKRQSRSGGLQTLKHVVVTGFGSIDFADQDLEERKDEDIKETEFIVKYDVSSNNNISEVYHKGIVESETLPSRGNRPHLQPIVSN